MIDYSKRKPLAIQLDAYINKQIENSQQTLGKFLPCSVVSVMNDGNGNTVPIVTVKFEINYPYPLPQVTIPVHGFEYIRSPIKVGDKGLAISADVFIDNITGLGETTTTTADTGNLSAMVFMPVGNSTWSYKPGNELTLYATATGAHVAVSANQVSLVSGGVSLTVNSTNVTIAGGDLIVSGKSFLNHEHPVSGIQTGGSTVNSGIPI
jgi:hypothetical protein